MAWTPLFATALTVALLRSTIALAAFLAMSLCYGLMLRWERDDAEARYCSATERAEEYRQQYLSVVHPLDRLKEGDRHE